MNRSFVIFDVSEIDLIDFNHVMESNVNTLRYSVDGTKTFVKWEGEEPNFLSLLTTKTSTYSYEQILEILATEEWTNNNPLP